MSEFNFILKKSSKSEYIIVSEKGFTLHTLTRCNGQEDAMNMAKAWASSWSCSTVRMEDEQSQQRD